MPYSELFGFLAGTEAKIARFLSGDSMNQLLSPEDIRAGATSYLQRPAKRLRPAVLLLSCGCANSSFDLDAAMAAAAGVELFHTWTLVHDDLIDNDDVRRGKPSVHREIEEASKARLGLGAQEAMEYGRDIAILAGDVLHAWSIKLFASLAENGAASASVALKLVTMLETETISSLIHGEALDVQYSFGYKGIDGLLGIGDSEITDMLRLKTGALYSFSAAAGAMVGNNTADENDPDVAALRRFAGYCGTAFQLQDDILGVIGDEEALGKPVGSDIREGKKTTILLEALRNASPRQRACLSAVWGDRSARPEDIEKAKSLLIELNGVGYTARLARRYIDDAIPCLDGFGDSPYKRMLLQWADYMVDRSF